MSARPFDIDQVIARIKECVPKFNSVEGAAEYSAIRELKDFRAPCAYVLLAQEKNDGENIKAPNAVQRALVTFGVVIIVKNYRDQRKGNEANEALRPLVGSVREALKGWQPELPGSRPCSWLQGDVADYDNTNLLWIDVFQTQHFIQ